MHKVESETRDMLAILDLNTINAKTCLSYWYIT